MDSEDDDHHQQPAGPDAETPEFIALLPVAAQQAPQKIEDAEEQRQRIHTAHDEYVNVLMRAAHRAQFPLTDNLMSLVFLAQADLNEIQRERFVTSMSLRRIDMTQYTYLQVKQLFMELFCTTRTGIIADPTIRHAKRSTFLFADEGECDGDLGYWVFEEETGEEGFVSLCAEDDFWVLGAKGSYTRKRVFNLQTRKRKRPRRQRTAKTTWLSFRPRSQKGKGYMTEEFQDDQVYYGKKGKKGGKKSGKKGKDSVKSGKKGKSKGDASSSTGKANLSGTSPSEEHVDVQDSSATGQDNWSDDNYTGIQTMAYGAATNSGTHLKISGITT